MGPCSAQPKDSPQVEQRLTSNLEQTLHSTARLHLGIHDVHGCRMNPEPL